MTASGSAAKESFHDEARNPAAVSREPMMGVHDHAGHLTTELFVAFPAASGTHAACPMHSPEECTHSLPSPCSCWTAAQSHAMLSHAALATTTCVEPEDSQDRHSARSRHLCVPICFSVLALSKRRRKLPYPRQMRVFLLLLLDALAPVQPMTMKARTISSAAAPACRIAHGPRQ